MATETSPADRLAWTNNQRAIRGLAPLTAAALASIQAEPDAFDDRDSNLSVDYRERAA